MNEKVDEAISMIMDLSIKEYEEFKPSTVAENLALQLVHIALNDGGFRAIQLVTERTAGKVSVNKKEKNDNSDIINKLRSLLNEDE